MKASRLICPDIRRIEVENFELPEMTDDAILVQNEYTAVSVGTEIYNWLHGSEPGQPAAFPRTTGYCNMGVVLEAGRKVKGIKAGDRVTAQGNHASHDVIKSLYYRVPDDVPSDAAAFLVMAAIAMRGIRKAHIELGESMVVMGLGIVGQLAASLARLCGAMPVIALDLDQRRLDIAKKRGVDHLVNPNTTSDVVECVRKICADDGANVVMEATGKPAVYPLAAQLACTAGRVIALGSPRGSVKMDFFPDVHLREVNIVGAFQPLTPDQPHVYYHWEKDRDRKLLLDLMARGLLPVVDLITHRFKPAQCQTVYEMLADRPQEALGVVFEWR